MPRCNTPYHPHHRARDLRRSSPLVRFVHLPASPHPVLTAFRSLRGRGRVHGPQNSTGWRWLPRPLSHGRDFAVPVDNSVDGVLEFVGRGWGDETAGMLDSSVQFVHLEGYLVQGGKSCSVDFFKVGLENAMSDGGCLYCAVQVLIALSLLGACDIRGASVARARNDEARGMNDVALSGVVFDGDLGLQTTCSGNDITRTDRIGKRLHQPQVFVFALKHFLEGKGNELLTVKKKRPWGSPSLRKKRRGAVCT